MLPAENAPAGISLRSCASGACFGARAEAAVTSAELLGAGVGFVFVPPREHAQPARPIPSSSGRRVRANNAPFLASCARLVRIRAARKLRPVIPPEISQHLSDELRLRLESRVNELGPELELLAARARACEAAPEDIALAAGVLLAMASSRAEAG